MCNNHIGKHVALLPLRLQQRTAFWLNLFYFTLLKLLVMFSKQV